MTISMRKPHSATAARAGDLPPRGYLVSGVAAVFVRDLLKQIRTPGTLVTQFVQIGFFIVLYGVGFSGMVGGVSQVSFLAFVYPGLIVIQIATVSLMAGLSLAWDRAFGFSRVMLVSPAPRCAIPLGKVGSTAVIAVVQAALMILAAPVLGIHVTPTGAVAALGAAALASAVFCLLGMFIAVKLRSIEVAQGVAQLAMFPMLFLSGSVFDPRSVPEWLMAVIALNPMTYGVALTRSSLLSGTDYTGFVAPGICVIVLTTLALVLGAVVTRSLQRSS